MGKIWTVEEEYSIVMESIENNISIAEICRNNGVASSLFYK